MKIPTHLVGDPPRITRILTLLNYSREKRRDVRAIIRKRHPSTSQDEADRVIVSSILLPEHRLRDFWRKVVTPNSTKREYRSVFAPLDLLLIQRYAAQQSNPVVDLELLRSSWVEFDEFRAKLRGIEVSATDEYC